MMGYPLSTHARKDTVSTNTLGTAILSPEANAFDLAEPIQEQTSKLTNSNDRKNIEKN